MIFAAKLAGAAAALCLSFAASTVAAADEGTQPITDRDQCHTCDMWITKYAGPKAEIVTKSGHVYKFCSTKCMTCTLLRLGVSEKIAGIWVNDMVGNDWEHPNASFIDAESAWYVQGSSRKATMGKSLASFSTEEAAVAFQKEFGGTIYRWNDLTKDILGCMVPKKPVVPME